MTTIETIRAEIERNRQAIRVLNEHTAPEQMSKTCAIFQYSDSILSELLSFLDTLEESKKCDGCNNVKGCVTCVNGDQWAHYEKSEKPTNLDLEKEIENAGKDVIRQAHYHNKIFDIPQTHFEDVQLMDIFKAGVYKGCELGRNAK